MELKHDKRRVWEPIERSYLGGYWEYVCKPDCKACALEAEKLAKLNVSKT